MKKDKKNDLVLWARQYSKRLITALLSLWAIGAVIGAVYEFIRLFTYPEIASMDAFYIYLAVPLSCGIPSYVIPNIFLNREKVRQNYIPDYDKIVLGGEDAGQFIDSGCDSMPYSETVTDTEPGLEEQNYDC